MRVVRGTLSLLVVLGTLACGGRAAPPLPGAADDRTISVEVQNQEFADATVYVLRNSMRLRLGIVTGKTSKTFSTEWFLPDIRLQVAFIGGGGFATDALDVSPGDLLLLIIPPGSQRWERP